jgi:hypothetical protein
LFLGDINWLQNKGVIRNSISLGWKGLLELAAYCQDHRMFSYYIELVNLNLYSSSYYLNRRILLGCYTLVIPWKPKKVLGFIIISSCILNGKFAWHFGSCMDLQGIHRHGPSV